MKEREREKPFAFHLYHISGDILQINENITSKFYSLSLTLSLFSSYTQGLKSEPYISE